MKKVVCLLILIATLIATSVEAQRPKQFVDALSNLAEVATLINICLTNKNFKNKLSAEESLKLSEYDMEIIDLVERLSSYYNDDTAYLTFELVRIKMTDDPDVINEFKEKYVGCGKKFSSDVKKYIIEAQESINMKLN